MQDDDEDSTVGAYFLEVLGKMLDKENEHGEVMRAEAKPYVWCVRLPQCLRS